MVAALSCSDKSNAGIADASIRIAAMMRSLRGSPRTQPCRAHHHCMSAIDRLPGWRQTRQPKATTVALHLRRLIETTHNARPRYWLPGVDAMGFIP
ncbi:hypothetical protein XAV_12980 [Xanthomonas axonopodis pv. vasculorum]|uniref:hypothetical protein n=1 Tax=Xanthomonas axonopodis TaxID=53413 RepID=UPI0014954676|nr:hypothetical protein [Xanthomonas axonopodis]QKD85166.1 hypothetical protein XAV_12980 [Xanthomonas axonopodis pv. vasculorum]